MIYKYDNYVKRFVTRDQYITECFGGLPNADLLGEQWDKMKTETIETDFDSEIETRKHIKRVNTLLINASIELLVRAKVHDASKLGKNEKPLFDIYTPKLKSVTYGSDEYKEMLSKLKPSLEHHYFINSHHPEHYKNGVNGMNLFDVIEMFLDWKAASERHNDGDLLKSIEINKNRFGLSEQLAEIFKNTVGFLFDGD